MDEFRDAIAKIEIEGTKFRGTGFLIAPDLVATALHVVADRQTEPPSFFHGAIHLKFRGGHATDAEVIQDKWNQNADCVLLRCLDAGPLAEYPIIPLRELSQSNDLWKTRGYPDAQPVDGTTWDGDVTSYTEQLTNSYAKRKVAYQPVIQLFCKQAGAGTGAPPRGLSGAPVVIGTAAVGLLRFALMQDGRATAGTLYACHAKDIAALYPERLGLRPPLAQVVVLTPAQIVQLTALLVAAFKDNLPGLRCTVRFSLGADAERSVASAKELTEFVSALVPALVQQGPGMISVLLRGAIMARGTDRDLRNFARQVSTYALEPLNDDPEIQENHDSELVTKISSALVELNTKRDVHELQHIMASYRPDFEKTRRQIGVLAKYKELHNCLHEIQERRETIANNVARLKSGDSVSLYLREDASFLKERARKARSQIPGLPTGDEQLDWINQLDACAADMKAATAPAASVEDTENVLKIPERLDHILPNAAHINEELVDAAKDVRLDNFAETMRSVEKQFGATLSDNSLKRLREGTLAVGRLRSRLAGLVAEHDEWQSINTDFEYTKTQDKLQPQAKFYLWRQFKAKLIGLCDVFPQEEWSIDLKEMMKPWMPDDPPPEPQIPANIKKIKDDFQSFHKQCVDRFIEVDKELNALCKKITSFGMPLDVLLSITRTDRDDHDSG
jgi:trypsin-like peptidase